MAATVTSSSSPRTTHKTVNLKSRNNGQVKRTRIGRRRGRVQDGLNSDDEIEREAGTDSETEDELSSLDSDSDSDTEPASEDVVPNGHFTPSTSQSPGDRGLSDKDSAPHLSTDSSSFFKPSGKWSEMVADEAINGQGDLPVIEFADFDGQVLPNGVRSRKSKKSAKPPPPPESTVSPAPPDSAPADAVSADDPATSSHRPSDLSYVRRPPGQTARQAYQQRLESDPSYVPTVGGFWGHDDRLLDKDLRSLSGWWRGRWQGRGRARGFMRGRGHAPYIAPHASRSSQGVDGPPSANEENITESERAWTHDGFEEMKRREEQRREAQQAQRQGRPPLRPTNGFRGRGFTSARGGRGVFHRSGYTPSPTRFRTNTPSSNPGRVWYAMKPELMWTKQHEAFLYYDTSLKPRQGMAGQLRVKLPGKEVQVIKAPPKSYASAPFANVSVSSVSSGSDIGEKAYSVRLPRPTKKEKGTVDVSADDEASMFTVRPHLVERNPIPLPEFPSVQTVSAPSPAPSRNAPLPLAAPSQPQLEFVPKSHLEQTPIEPQRTDAARQAGAEEAILKNLPNGGAEESQAGSLETGQRPQLPVVQTVFTPPLPQPSPGYGSPYTYTPTLPPGIAMNQHGMAYELATGRPVYLQAPPPMFNPRPIMHSHLPGMQFVPSHMPHQSAVSPDFLAQPTPHTPPVNGFIDPATGTPIFSFPRQSSRIQIRAPSENPASTGAAKSSSRSSGSHTGATTGEPSRSSDNSANGFFPSIAAPSYRHGNGAQANGSADEGQRSQQQHMADPSMGAYPHYSQPYYYGEAFNYVPYMDMSQQVGQYEMYPTDSLLPQGTVYY